MSSPTNSQQAWQSLPFYTNFSTGWFYAIDENCFGKKGCVFKNGPVNYWVVFDDEEKEIALLNIRSDSKDDLTDEEYNQFVDKFRIDVAEKVALDNNMTIA